jgi:hypothetical protein
LAVQSASLEKSDNGAGVRKRVFIRKLLNVELVESGSNVFEGNSLRAVSFKGIDVKGDVLVSGDFVVEVDFNTGWQDHVGIKVLRKSVPGEDGSESVNFWRKEDDVAFYSFVGTFGDAIVLSHFSVFIGTGSSIEVSFGEFNFVNRSRLSSGSEFLLSEFIDVDDSDIHFVQIGVFEDFVVNSVFDVSSNFE